VDGKHLLDESAAEVQHAQVESTGVVGDRQPPLAVEVRREQGTDGTRFHRVGSALDAGFYQYRGSDRRQPAREP
jgi:hypothetical protein